VLDGLAPCQLGQDLGQLVWSVGGMSSAMLWPVISAAV
jgi:hypothetical protein